MKGSHRWEHAAEKEKEKGKEGETAKDSASSLRREGAHRWKEDEGGVRSGPAAAPQPGVLSATILQHEVKKVPPRTSQQATPTEAISGVRP